MTSQPRCFALVGQPQGGKTYALRALVARLREQGVSVVGVVQPTLGDRAPCPAGASTAIIDRVAPSRTLGGAGAREGYAVESLRTGERRALAEQRPLAEGRALATRRAFVEGHSLDEASLQAMHWPEGLGFGFHPSAFLWAAKELCSPGAVLVLDEVGLLEGQGEGHMPGLKRGLLVPGRRAVVLAVRHDALPLIREHIGGPEVWPLPPHAELNDRITDWVNTLKEALS